MVTKHIEMVPVLFVYQRMHIYKKFNLSCIKVKDLKNTTYPMLVRVMRNGRLNILLLYFIERQFVIHFIKLKTVLSLWLSHSISRKISLRKV